MYHHHDDNSGILFGVALFIVVAAVLLILAFNMYTPDAQPVEPQPPVIIVPSPESR